MVRDTQFGTALEDLYRWMEQEDEELHRWLERQAGDARSVLDAMPRPASLLARVPSLSGVLPQISDLRMAGERTFYLWLVRRPELWAAMVMHVPMLNATRVAFSENGPINVPEFGSVTTEEGLRALL